MNNNEPSLIPCLRIMRTQLRCASEKVRGFQAIVHPVRNPPETLAYIRMAYCHLEDAIMRLGKALKEAGGGDVNEKCSRSMALTETAPAADDPLEILVRKHSDGTPECDQSIRSALLAQKAIRRTTEAALAEESQTHYASQKKNTSVGVASKLDKPFRSADYTSASDFEGPRNRNHGYGCACVQCISK